MVIIILATVLILGIAFYQSVQGCFSAMIMAILTVLCAMVALNYYEPLGDLLADRMGAFAHPAALLALFVAPLLGLREIFDRLIRGNVLFGMWGERIGGGVFGLFSGTVLTGMFMIIFQLLPMPASILTYQPYDGALAVKRGGPPRWAAECTLAIAEHLSGASLRPITVGRKFSDAHDDLLLETFCQRNRPRGGRASARTNALEVAAAYVVEVPTDKKRIENLSPVEIAKLKANVSGIQDKKNGAPEYPPLSHWEKGNTKVLAVRVRVSGSACDEDGWFRLPATHFRLVCESGRSFYPVGYLTHTGDIGWQVNTVVSEKGLTQITDILVARSEPTKKGAGKLLVDWLYRIPAAEEPDYMVFRRTAKASLPPVIEGLPDGDNALYVGLKKRRRR